MAYSGLSMWREAKKDGLECIRLNKEFLKGYHRAANAMIQLVDISVLYMSEQNEFVEAEEVLNQGLKYNANDANLLALLRIAEPKVRSYPQANVQAKEIREREMNKLPPLDRYKAEGNELFKSSKFPDAIKAVDDWRGDYWQYTKAIDSVSDGECNDTLIACYNNRSACFQQLGDYESVVGDTTWVLEHDVRVILLYESQPKNVKALLRRGLAYENLERYRSALEDIRSVLAINPNIEMANSAQVGL